MVLSCEIIINISHVFGIVYVVYHLWQEQGSNLRSTGHEPAEIPLLHPAPMVLHTSRCFSITLTKKQKTLNKIYTKRLNTLLIINLVVKFSSAVAF